MISEATSPSSTGPLLSLTGLHKWFGGVHALNDARMVIKKPGVVHALMGQNGSGKSTMLNVLSGQLRPDEGKIEIEGKEVIFRSPVDSLAAGVSMVAQETALAEDLSIAENILLGRRLVRGRLGIDWRATTVRAQEILDHVGVDYDPTQIVRNLRPDEKQMVEIARAISTNAKILILDEPTSSLTDRESEFLFKAIRGLKEKGVIIIYVSHRLPEVFDIADEMTVLRDGETVTEGITQDYKPETLVEAMVGGSSLEVGAKRSGKGGAKSILKMNNLNLEGSYQDVNLEIFEGEIVGVGGLVGSGRQALLETIFGIRQPDSGEMILTGEEVHLKKPYEAIKNGIGYVPPDRKIQGVILPMAVQDNLSIASTYKSFRLKNPTSRTIWERCFEISNTLRIKAAQKSPVHTLSGGNQQKVALGKWLLEPPKLLLLDEPTRGVDVAAKKEIQSHLWAVADKGLTLFISSSEYDELSELCDRVIIMFQGQIVADVPREEATETKLAALGGGSI